MHLDGHGPCYVAERLADAATSVWVLPSLPADVLDAYHPNAAERIGRYTVDDHAQLAQGQLVRPLFEALRKEVMALDPCVTEEFLKF